MNLEKELESKGYKVVDETPPFKLYEKKGRRLVYHIPSGKIWGKFDFNTGERRSEKWYLGRRKRKQKE